MKYLVSHAGQQIGPFTAEEIVSKLRARELESLDYAFDEKSQDWILLTEVAAVVTLLKGGAKPTRPEAAFTITEWFVLKGQTKFGPFPYQEMIALLQKKIVYPFDFCWHAGMSEWTRVAEVAQFHASEVRDLRTKAPDVFIPRRFARTIYRTSVLLHDQVRVWRGEARELSRGGLGVSSITHAFTPGQTVTLHCAATEDLPAFVAVCEVVAKTFVTDGSPVEYGLRFLELSPDARQSIHAKVA